jgi:hypothetical protein
MPCRTILRPRYIGAADSLGGVCCGYFEIVHDPAGGAARIDRLREPGTAQEQRAEYHSQQSALGITF